MDKISNKQVRQSVYHKYNSRCAYCGVELFNKFTIDHIVPKRRGDKTNNGPDIISNYNPCCYPCNSSKGTFTIDKWRKNIQHKIIQLNRDSATYRTAKRFGLVREPNHEVII